MQANYLGLVEHSADELSSHKRLGLRLLCVEELSLEFDLLDELGLNLA